MKNLEKRRDRFDFFERFEKPQLNVTFKLTVPDFIPYCKKNNLPVFHFFLFQVFKAATQIDNFLYRIYQGEVIKIDTPIASYTSMSEGNLFNYTQFEHSNDMKTFIERSLVAKEETQVTSKLINTGLEMSEREMKNYFFITSLPWLEFTHLEHPVFKFKSADIPSLSWGKFNPEAGKLTMPFSIQAHHGFVDAYHMHLFSETIAKNIEEQMK